MNGRPMGAILPILNQGAPTARSLGCTGSRLTTEIGRDKMVVGVRGDRLEEFSIKLDRIVKANRFVDAEDSKRKAVAVGAFHKPSYRNRVGEGAIFISATGPILAPSECFGDSQL
jgi:hypothetical protein